MIAGWNSTLVQSRIRVPEDTPHYAQTRLARTLPSPFRSLCGTDTPWLSELMVSDILGLSPDSKIIFLVVPDQNSMDSTWLPSSVHAQISWLEESNKLLCESQKPAYLPGSWMHAHALHTRLRQVEAQNELLRSRLELATELLSRELTHTTGDITSISPS